jgi:two-component system chemotaxis response regulator CheB
MTQGRRTTVLVVDDSAFMRKAVGSMLEKDPEIEVIGTARNGEEALSKIRELDPQVVTLDIEMPVMDGLTALRSIMMQFPRPVLMLSSLTTDGAEATLKALELGAVDFIPKQLSHVSLDIIKIEKDLQAKVKNIARRKVKPVRAERKPPAVPGPEKVLRLQAKTQRRDIVGIGVSTGGPPAVQKILGALPAEFPASILIAQHMPGTFTKAFAKRLNQNSPLEVKEAEQGDRLETGHVYIAPGGFHLKIRQRVRAIDLNVTMEPRDALYKPSANVLLTSIADGAGRRGLGVILTGMGNDGLEGIRDLKRKGGATIAQDNASCVVYGMPRAVVEAGLADAVVDIESMAESILEHLFVL